MFVDAVSRNSCSSSYLSSIPARCGEGLPTRCPEYHHPKPFFLAPYAVWPVCPHYLIRPQSKSGGANTGRSLPSSAQYVPRTPPPTCQIPQLPSNRERHCLPTASLCRYHRTHRHPLYPRSYQGPRQTTRRLPTRSTTHTLHRVGTSTVTTVCLSRSCALRTSALVSGRADVSGSA